MNASAAFSPRSQAVLGYLDVVLMLIGVGLAIALGAPVLGCAFGAGGWVLQRLVAAVDQRWTHKAVQPVRQLGIRLFEAYARIWLLAGVIVASAVIGGRPDGLAAAVVIFGAYSVAFLVRLISGPPRRRAAD